jgi:hypothetical protein
MSKKLTQREKKAAGLEAKRIQDENRRAEELSIEKAQAEDIEKARIAAQERAELAIRRARVNRLKNQYASIKIDLFFHGNVPEKKVITINSQKFVKCYMGGVVAFMHEETKRTIEQCQIYLEIESIDGMFKTTPESAILTIKALNDDMGLKSTFEKKQQYIAYFIEKFKFHLFDELNLDLKTLTSEPNCSLLVYYYIIYCKIYMIGSSDTLTPYQKNFKQMFLVYLLHLWSAIVVPSDDISDAIIEFYDKNEGDMYVMAVSSEFSIKALDLR